MGDRSTAHFDVVIMGGGPGGATLGALLAQRTDLRVAIYEKAIFPRPHIGESFIARVTHLLQHSGALNKVLASDCWLKKEGAFFDWDPQAEPYTLLFGYEDYQRDGIPRWAFHVERAIFDAILLDHASDCGAHVYQGNGVNRVHQRQPLTRIELDDGSEVSARVFVDASGRQSSILDVPRAYLSSYRNIAIWTHFTGGRMAHSLPGDWNLFREQQLRPAGSFAFEDGWFWYIPTRRRVNGQVVITHSLGMVTDPAVLKEPGKRYTEIETFLARARRLPHLGELLTDAEPLTDRLQTATNYSMISQQFCSYDERWILLGDSAFFVDPLFASGVTLAVSEAFSAAFMIEATLLSSLPEQGQRDLWGDYNQRYRATADTLAMMIDQWYHAIGRIYPDSSYRKRQEDWSAADQKEQTIDTLFDLSLLDAFLDFSIPAQHKERWMAFFQSGRQPGSGPLSLAADAMLRLSAGVTVRRGALLGAVSAEVPVELWTDPRGAAAHMTPLVPFHACHRFCRPAGSDADTVPFIDQREHGLALYALLARGPQRYGALSRMLLPAQRPLLDRLLRAGLLDVAG